MKGALNMLASVLGPPARAYRIELLREDWRTTFAGTEMLLIGTPVHGAIATREQYENFEVSFAQLTRSGIYRYNVKIGEPTDIRIIEEETPA